MSFAERASQAGGKALGWFENARDTAMVAGALMAPTAGLAPTATTPDANRNAAVVESVEAPPSNVWDTFVRSAQEENNDLENQLETEYEHDVEAEAEKAASLDDLEAVLETEAYESDETAETEELDGLDAENEEQATEVEQDSQSDAEPDDGPSESDASGDDAHESAGLGDEASVDIGDDLGDFGDMGGDDGDAGDGGGL